MRIPDTAVRFEEPPVHRRYQYRIGLLFSRKLNILLQIIRIGSKRPRPVLCLLFVIMGELDQQEVAFAQLFGNSGQAALFNKAFGASPGTRMIGNSKIIP
ncbi:hypothetical protein D3C76_1479710 [compost metagenome]